MQFQAHEKLFTNQKSFIVLFFAACQFTHESLFSSFLYAVNICTHCDTLMTMVGPDAMRLLRERTMRRLNGEGLKGEGDRKREGAEE